MANLGERLPLDDAHCLFRRELPAELLPNDDGFEVLWALHPEAFHLVRMHGREVPTPRWQQAYGRAYDYSGSRNEALPVAPELAPYLEWTRREIDARLNGLLLNWYDGARGHYIGKHRDTFDALVPGAPIVTISLGESRLFRLRPWKGQGFQDFPADHGSVFILPFETNLAWTHEVPKSKRATGRRISLTFRAFA